MFEKNKEKLIKSQQSLIESLKKQNNILKKENDTLKNKILAHHNATDKEKLDFKTIMKELKDTKNEYESLIKELKEELAEENN